MNGMQIFYLVLLFVAVSAAAFGMASLFSPKPTRDRLKKLSEGEEVQAPPETSKWKETIAKASREIAKLALPSEGWDKSPFRLRFIHAGYRGGSAPTVFFTTKAVFALGFPAIFSLVLFLGDITIKAQMALFWLLAMATAGYYLPNVYLAKRIASRKLELFETFPDAVDLVMVCVESGLGLDASIVRAGEEMRLRSPVLADELQLVALELRAGGGRDHALRNLAMRTGMEEVDNLVSMLIQADKFGTSVADSLRVYADTLRTKRRLRAEEAAAKIALKLLFPLIFCIFPALLLVLMGPAFIRIYRIMLPTLSG